MDDLTLLTSFLGACLALVVTIAVLQAGRLLRLGAGPGVLIVLTVFASILTLQSFWALPGLTETTLALCMSFAGLQSWRDLRCLLGSASPVPL